MMLDYKILMREAERLVARADRISRRSESSKNTLKLVRTLVELEEICLRLKEIQAALTLSLSCVRAVRN